MEPEDLSKPAFELINGQSTMALATTCQGMAWSAPVYFVYYHAAFYFFSDPQSRHIREAIENPHVAASLYPHVETWQEIRGIQMSGRIDSVCAGWTALQAVRAYIAKFPFTQDFFDQGQAVALEDFIKRFRVKLYRLLPEMVFYLDNRIAFGFRREIRLP